MLEMKEHIRTAFDESPQPFGANKDCRSIV
jgi:hypothetical protein